MPSIKKHMGALNDSPGALLNLWRADKVINSAWNEAGRLLTKDPSQRLRDADVVPAVARVSGLSSSKDVPNAPHWEHFIGTQKGRGLTVLLPPLIPFPILIPRKMNIYVSCYWLWQSSGIFGYGFKVTSISKMLADLKLSFKCNYQ